MQSWDMRTSQAFIWRKTVFVSPLSSMRLNKQGVRSAPHTHTHLCVHTHSCTHASTHGLIDRTASLFWLWVWVPSWYLRLVDWQSCAADSRHTHTLTYRDTHTLCQGHTVPGCNVCQLQGHKERQRQWRKSRTVCVCVWRRKTVRVDKVMKKKRKRSEWLLQKCYSLLKCRLKLKLSKSEVKLKMERIYPPKNLIFVPLTFID